MGFRDKIAGQVGQQSRGSVFDDRLDGAASPPASGGVFEGADTHTRGPQGPEGPAGAAGVGIMSITQDPLDPMKGEDSELIVTLTDESEQRFDLPSGQEGSNTVLAENESAAVTGSFSTLNFIGDGVTASSDGTTLDIHITGGGSGVTVYNPTVTISPLPPAQLEIANLNPGKTLTDVVVVPNTGFTLTGLSITGTVSSVAIAGDHRSGAFAFDYNQTIVGTYSFTITSTATDVSGTPHTHTETHSTVVFAPVYAQVLLTEPVGNITQFTSPSIKARFTGDLEFTFPAVENGMLYYALPINNTPSLTTPVFKSGVLFLDAELLDTTFATHWALYQVTDYNGTGTLHVALTSGG